MTTWAPVPGVNDLLVRLRDGASVILGERLFGIALYGSLATGGFTAETSDIDFVVALNAPLSPEQDAALEAFHRRLQVEGGKWAAKLEGAYVPLADLRRRSAETGPYLVINEGQIYRGGLGSDWVIQRHTLVTNPVSVVGPSLAEHIDPVSIEELQAAVRGIFTEWWNPMVREGDLLERHDYRQYAVLTMCRVLQLFHTGVTASKPAAAEWALTALDPRWHPLIRWAQAWTPGAPAAEVDEVKAMIREGSRAVK